MVEEQNGGNARANICLKATTKQQNKNKHKKTRQFLFETQKGKFTRHLLEKQMAKYMPNTTFEEQFKKKKELNKSKT